MGVEMAEKKVTDWEAVEFAYRAGVKTLREIGEEYGVSHTLVARKAKKEGWTRDLSQKIKAQADAIVSKATVSSRVTVETEKAVVAGNAQVQADVRLNQRKDIQRFRAYVMSLADELVASKDDLPKRISSAKLLTDSHKTLVAMEREAFGIDSRFEDEEIKAVAADPQDLARRIAFLLAQSIHKGT